MLTVDLSPLALSLLNNLRSRGGAIRGNIARDKVMWLYWPARPGETVAADIFKELLAYGLIEFQADLTNGEKRFRLSELGRSHRDRFRIVPGGARAGDSA